MRGVVAAGNPHTAQAAAEVLRAGGNAVDAACAAALATFSAEPLLASAGGAGLAIVALRGQAPKVVDFFSRAPGLGGAARGETDFEAVEIDFGSAIQIFHVGRGSATVPLALPGIAEAVRRFGARPLPEVVAPAARMARAGVPLTPEGADVFSLLWPILKRDPLTVALYSDDDAPPPPGRLMVNADLADTLVEFGQVGGLPERARTGLLSAFGPSRGGLITEADVEAASEIHIVEPRSATLGELAAFTSPRIGGQLVTEILNELATLEDTDEVTRVRALARASQKAHLAHVGLEVPGSTTHISVLDADDNAAAITLTNGEGCGHLIEGTGIQVNNFLGEEDLNPDGFHLHAPGAPLPTMVAPTIALRDGRPALALGSGGANRIRSSVSQVLYRVAMRGRSLEEAVMAPRVHAETDAVWLERGGLADPEAVIAALSGDFDRVFPFPDRAFFFGGVHAVMKNVDGTASCFGDPRRGGVGLVVE
jgi:gamma-glutamyltranspeptidase/glutathione hydrolase